MRPKLATTSAFALAARLTISALVSAEVNVSAYRQPFLINPLFDAFTKKTGITRR